MENLIKRLDYKKDYNFIGYIKGAIYAVPYNIENEECIWYEIDKSILNISKDELNSLIQQNADHSAVVLNPHKFVSEIPVYKHKHKSDYLIGFPFITRLYLNSFKFKDENINPLKFGVKIDDVADLKNVMEILKNITEQVKNQFKNEVSLPQNILLQDGLTFDDLEISEKRFVAEKYDEVWESNYELINKL